MRAREALTGSSTTSGRHARDPAMRMCRSLISAHAHRSCCASVRSRRGAHGVQRHSRRQPVTRHAGCAVADRSAASRHGARDVAAARAAARRRPHRGAAVQRVAADDGDDAVRRVLPHAIHEHTVRLIRRRGAGDLAAGVSPCDHVPGRLRTPDWVEFHDRRPGAVGVVRVGSHDHLERASRRQVADMLCRQGLRGLLPRRRPVPVRPPQHRHPGGGRDGSRRTTAGSTRSPR